MLQLWETHHVTGKRRGAASALKKVLAAAKSIRVEPVLIGAGALSSYGAPRYSEDIDFLLPRAGANKLVRALLDAGFKGPAPSSGIYFFPLLSPERMEIDILAATESLPLDAVRSSRPSRFLGVGVTVPSPEFFVLLKLLAADKDPSRELRHLGDVQDLLRVQSTVDLELVRNYVEVHAPDLLPVLGRLLASTRRAARAARRPQN